MKLFVRTAAALALSLVSAAAALAQGLPPTLAAGNSLLTISADGRSSHTPDLAVFSAGVTSEGQTASTAMAANAAAMNRVIATLKQAGLADKAIQTSNLSLVPVYAAPRADGAQEMRIIAYQANNTVYARTSEIKGFGKVLDALVAAGANQINGPSLQLADPDAAYDEARLAAMKAARARAEIYARAAGLRVVRIISIGESGGYPSPQPVFAKALALSADAPTPLAAGEVASQISVSVQFELAPR